MDKSWINESRLSQNYRLGVKSFLDFAFGKSKAEMMKCPCTRCSLAKSKSKEDIEGDLMCFGFLNSYTHWVLHGEESSSTTSLFDDQINMAHVDDEFSRVFGPERSGRVRCVGRGPTPSKLTKHCATVRAEADCAEVVQLRTNMTSLQNQVENFTVVIQQLLGARASDQASAMAAYATILNPNPPTSEGRRDEVNRNQNDDSHNSEDH